MSVSMNMKTARCRWCGQVGCLDSDPWRYLLKCLLCLRGESLESAIARGEAIDHSRRLTFDETGAAA